MGRPGRAGSGSATSDDIADDISSGINAAYPEVKEFLDAVDDINSTVAKQIAPLLKPIDATGAPVPQEITDLLAVSASDPLSLTPDDIERRIAAITELVAFQANWPKAISETAASVSTPCATPSGTRRRPANAPPRRC